VVVVVDVVVVVPFGTVLAGGPLADPAAVAKSQSDAAIEATTAARAWNRNVMNSPG
jgi:hypothetical protein